MSQPPGDPAPPRRPRRSRPKPAAIVGLAIAARLRVRLMGGLAIRIAVPERQPAAVRARRTATSTSSPTRRTSAALRRLLEARGLRRRQAVQRDPRRVSGWCTAQPMGAGRSTSSSTSWRCRTRLDLRDRLATDGPTLDLADLLLTKLQIWETNQKDLGDAACLLADHPLAPGRPTGRGSRGRRRARADRPGPDPVRPRADWGFCHTVERNLRDVAELVGAAADPGGAVSRRRAGRRPAGRHRRPPRSRSAGRPARGSASGSAGTRRPRRRAARRSTTAVGHRRRDRPGRGPRASSRPRRPRSSSTAASSCSNGGDHLEDEGGRRRRRPRPAPRAPGRHRSDPAALRSAVNGQWWSPSASDCWSWMTGATGPSSRSQAYGSRSSPVVPGTHMWPTSRHSRIGTRSPSPSVSRSRIIAIVDGSRAAARFSTSR